MLMKKFTLFLMSMFIMLGTAVAQDNALTLVKAVPADKATVRTVEYIQLEFSKEVNVTLPEGGIAVTNEETKEVYNLTSYNPFTPKNIVLLSFEQKENDKGDMEQNLPKDAGTYTYTFPSGCITTADGEEFAQTLSFTIENPFELSFCNPSNKVPVSKVEVLQLQFSQEINVAFPKEPITITNDKNSDVFEISNIMAYGSNAIIYVKKVEELAEDQEATTAITGIGTYTYTIPAGVITSKNGEAFPETTFTFTIAEPFEFVNYSPQETTKLDKIEITFSTPVASVKSPTGLSIVDNSWAPVANIKEEVTFSNDGKTVILELETPITAEGTYNLDINNGTFTSESGVNNEFMSLAFNVIDPSPAMITNYQDGDKVKTLGNLEIAFKNINEITIDENMPIKIFTPAKVNVPGTVTMEGKKAIVTFDQEQLTEPGEYTFVIPAGFFTMDGTPNELLEIYVTLVTLEIKPLEIIDISPNEKTVGELGKIVITFNQDVTLSQKDWQQISREIKMTCGDKEYILTYNSESNVGCSLEYLVNAEWKNNQYEFTPITEEGEYTLDLSQIVVDHAAEQGIDEYGYPALIWNSQNQRCEGKVTWTIDTTAIDKVKGENTEQVIYDLTGRRVETITAPGIYIVNSKKVLVK